MLKVILTKGLPGSGKSTWAKSLIDKRKNTYKRVSKDDLRAMLDNSHWSGDAEKFVLKIRDAIILEALNAGKHVIVDDTNLHPKHETHIRQLVKGKAEVVIQDFTDVDVEECIRRDLIRPNSVGHKVIRGMYNQFLVPNVEAPTYDSKLPDCYIVDIDGTVAQMVDRGPFEWDKVGRDTHVESICKTIGSLADGPVDIIFFSGRDEVCQLLTEKWLDKIPYSGFSTRAALYMRSHNDSRKDSIVKEEFYRKYIEGKYNVLGVFDDRLQVCRMWHRLGLPLFRVGDPDADF